jgi:transposase
MAAHVRMVQVADADRRELQRRARGKGAPAREVERARIVLLAADGMPGKRIAAMVGCAEPTVVTWRRRYAESGLAGLAGLPWPRKPSPLPDAVRDRVLQLTLTEPPTAYGVTHWSSRLLAQRLAGRGDADLARHHHPDLAPLRRAAVARTNIQVLHRSGVERQDRRRGRAVSALTGEGGGALRGPEAPDSGPAAHRPGPGPRSGRPSTTSGTAPRPCSPLPRWPPGKVTDACTDRHRHPEFLGFLKQVAAAYPRRQLHVVVDNLATHQHPAVRAWLARHPRVRLHFTPTSGSWLNLVEAFFSILTRQALRRGNFPTVADLIAAIGRLIDAWNDRCAPFTSTKDPDTVIAKATHPRHRKTQ